MPCPEQNYVAAFACCGVQPPPSWGSYLAFATTFVGAGGFEDVTFAGHTAQPQYRKYAQVTQRFESLEYPNAWREARYSYPTIFPGIDIWAWDHTVPLLDSQAMTPSTITDGPAWGVTPVNMMISDTLLISLSDSQLIIGVNPTTTYPQGAWKWTVSLSGVREMHQDLSEMLALVAAYPDDYISTFPVGLIDTDRRIASFHYSPSGWITGALSGRVAKHYGARAALHHQYRFQLVNVRDQSGAYPWGLPVILGGEQSLFCSNVATTMIHIKRKLDSPFERTDRCRYTQQTASALTSNLSGKVVECVTANYLGNDVINPTYGQHPEDYLYDGGTAGQTRTLIIPPDNSDPLVGIPPCCNVAP